MTQIEMSTPSSGSIGLIDRSIRIALGMAVLFGALYASIESLDAYPIIKMVSAIVVLTGIVGWDPLYALYRTTMASLSRKTSAGQASFNPS